jgi:Zc3h12a-like ribonuclease protein
MSRGQEGLTPIVVDGSNIAYLETTKDGKPRVDAIERVRGQLETMGYRPIVIVDAALWHQVDDRDRLNKMIDEGVINQAPAGTDADYFVLETARRENARIVTDDRYRSYADRFPDSEERRTPVMIVDGMVEFYNLKPAGS